MEGGKGAIVEPEPTSSPSPLLTLPQLVIAKISTFLSLPDKLAMRLVSRWWQRVMAEERVLFMRMTVTTESVLEFLNSTISSMENVTFEYLSSRLYDFSMNSRKIRNVGLGLNVSSEVLKAFFKTGTRWLESLTVSKGALEGISSEIPEIVAGTDWTLLTGLTFFIAIQWNSKDLESCCDFLENAKLLHMRSIGLHISHKYGPSNPDSPVHNLHCKFYQFILAHIQSLQILKYSLESYQKNQFKKQKIPQALLRAIALPESKIFDFALDTNIFEAYKEFIALLTSSTTPLSKIKIRVQASEWLNPHTVDAIKLQEILQIHSGTLKEIELENTGSTRINVAFLENCTHQISMLSLKSELDDWGGIRTISFPQLKNFQFTPNRVTWKLLEIVSSSIEKLTISEHKRNFGFMNQPLPRIQYNALRILQIDRLSEQTFNRLRFAVFPKLEEFKARVEGWTGWQKSQSGWMTLAMPNLHVAKLPGVWLDRACLKHFITMRNLTVYFSSYSTMGVDDFCKSTPGITLRAIPEESRLKLDHEDADFPHDRDRCKYQIIID